MAEVDGLVGRLDTTSFACRETGDDLERPDVQGLTMLMWASAYGQTPTVQVGTVNSVQRESHDLEGLLYSCC